MLTDHCSDILFCPTKTAVENLKREGITNTVNNTTPYSAPHIVNVGDVMCDAALFFGDKAKRMSNILATVHRAENTDNPARLMEIFEGLDEVAGDISVILPLHPRTGKLLANIKFSSSNLKLIPPLGYLDMVMLEKNARLILTDSGGIQKEAFFHEVPCVTLRDETEWVELVETGVNVLVGADKGRIMQGISRMIEKEIDSSSAVYGKGDAAEKMVEILATWCGGHMLKNVWNL